MVCNTVVAWLLQLRGGVIVRFSRQVCVWFNDCSFLWSFDFKKGLNPSSSLSLLLCISGPIIVSDASYVLVQLCMFACSSAAVCNKPFSVSS